GQLGRPRYVGHEVGAGVAAGGPSLQLGRAGRQRRERSQGEEGDEEGRERPPTDLDLVHGTLRWLCTGDRFAGLRGVRRDIGAGSRDREPRPPFRPPPPRAWSRSTTPTRVATTRSTSRPPSSPASAP